MNTATVMPTRFDEDIIDTLEHCITKMSKKLKEIFNPDKAESKSLFRLFCSAVNVRSRMLQKMANAIQKAHQAMNNSQKNETKAISDQANIQNTASEESNDALMTPKKKKQSRVGTFWRNKKLA
jgi:hypothetical protein